MDKWNVPNTIVHSGQEIQRYLYQKILRSFLFVLTLSSRQWCALPLSLGLVYLPPVSLLRVGTGIEVDGLPVYIGLYAGFRVIPWGCSTICLSILVTGNSRPSSSIRDQFGWCGTHPSCTLVMSETCVSTSGFWNRGRKYLCDSWDTWDLCKLYMTLYCCRNVPVPTHPKNL